MKKLLLIFGSSLGIVIVVLLFIGLIAFLTAPRAYNVLIIGSDQRGTERARSDVLFVMSLPKSGSKQPVFLSVPRDTKIESEQYGLQKITHFYAMGDRTDDGKRLGNRDLTKKTVEELLDIHVDATVEVTFDSFEEIIDSVGGVTLDGKEVDGEKALLRIRDRFTEGRSDFDRQSDEREVFRALLTKVKTPARAQDLYNYFQTSDKARMTFSKARFGHFMYGAGVSRLGNMSIGDMKELEVPGRGERIYTPDFGKSLYYWVVNEEELKKLMEENF